MLCKEPLSARQTMAVSHCSPLTLHGLVPGTACVKHACPCGTNSTNQRHNTPLSPCHMWRVHHSSGEHQPVRRRGWVGGGGGDRHTTGGCCSHSPNSVTSMVHAYTLWQCHLQLLSTACYCSGGGCLLLAPLHPNSTSPLLTPCRAQS